MKLNNEMKVGILVVTVSIGLFWLTVKVGNFNFSAKGYELEAHFQQIEGLDLNAPVRLNGLEVGSVKTIKYNPDESRMELSLWIDESAKIREGATARIKTMGFLGDKYLGVSSGDKDSPFLMPGAIIMGREPVDFERLIEEGEKIAKNLSEISENLKERLRINGEAIDQIVLNVNEFTGNLSERLKINSKSIDEIIVNTNTATKNIASISENINERLAVNQYKIDGIVENLNVTSGNLVDLSDDLKLNPWKLLYKEKTKKGKIKAK